MNTCPHCGATLRDGARFCPRCMTPLDTKRVVPTPKYALRRWLSATAALLVLLLAVGGVWTVYRQTPPVTDRVINTTTAADSTTTTAAVETTTTAAPSTSAATAGETATATTAAPSTTLTTLADFFETYPTETITTSTSLPTSVTTTSAWPTTTRTYPTSTTTATRTTTTSKKTTTTTQPTTTTTTKPYWLDATPAAVTEDGLPIEEVEWTYEHIFESTMYLARCQNIDNPTYTAPSIRYTASLSGVPLYYECIKVTGCVGTTSNGIYRVPATIDGYVVAEVDFGDSFADEATALTVKRIYLPPDAFCLLGGIDKCTNLEGLYVTAKEFWIIPYTLPDCGSFWYGGNEVFNLAIYVPSPFTPSFIAYDYVGVWTYACKGRVYDAEPGNISDADCQLLYGGGGV